MRRLRFELRSVLANQQVLFPALLRFRPRYRGILPLPETDIVIEGFPRSGNTFAFVAFESCQDRPVRVVRHTHAPGVIRRSARLGKPILLLVREPRAAAASLLVFEPQITAAQALRAYVRFHRPLVEAPSSWVVATFQQVITDFGAVIRRVNDRFGTDFAPFDHTPENVASCMRRIDQLEAADSGGEIREERVGRPSAHREALKSAAARRLEAPGLRTSMRVAEEQYALFESQAGSAA